MSKVQAKFIINDEEWKNAQLERIDYERQLHVLHQMRRLGATIKDGGKILSDDEIDYLSAGETRKICINTRMEYTGDEVLKLYKTQLEKMETTIQKNSFRGLINFISKNGD
ncbi:hypothetical protein [Clostridium tyrobutyricum]|jgi:hypothetical protein|uniref:hypothetical protein n=1 Tax=Clostridium tyrobutyricum TaxID=1519 RepID=UPI001C37EB1B|nr:hypothetical protein [Clostridium tyrobutyricum]MBV4429652.1 hypothetical protein [Clostridium tyrobutyricum]MBV4444889.1 hypothetical protein [Clostridium tyrobutyricum]